jgi:hypothetical protein
VSDEPTYDSHGADALGDTAEMPAVRSEAFAPADATDATGGPPPGAPGKKRVPVWAYVVAGLAVVGLALGAGVLVGGLGDDGEADTTTVAQAETDTTIAVPDLRGMTLNRATDDITAAGLAVGEVAYVVAEDTVAPAGTVISHDPLPGAKVEPGSSVSLVIALAPVVEDDDDKDDKDDKDDSSGGGGSSQPPAAPEDVTVDDFDMLIVQPKFIKPELILAPQWQTVLEHTGAEAEWTSGAITLGSGEKRIILTGDGPAGYLVGVHSWGAGDTDWHLRSLVVSAPGGASFETELDVAAGTHTFRVKSQDTSVLWTVTVQEKK